MKRFPSASVVYLKFGPLAVIFLVVFLLGCTPATPIIPTPLATAPPATPTQPQITATTSPPTATLQPATPSVTAAEATPLSNPFPLSEPGPYQIGKRQVSFVDDSRGGREVSLSVYYPAILPEGETGKLPSRDAEPDLSGAPYPMLLSSTKMAGDLVLYLGTYGFIWVGVDRIDSYSPWNTQLIIQPQDLLFALDQVASNPPEGLEAVIDSENVGVIGYSFDAFNSLALSGARIDPQFYLDQCAQAPTMEPPPPEAWIRYICTQAEDWDAFVATAGEAITTSNDGLWQPLTDERIKAAMPMAPEGAWLFGERGLAAVDRPTLIIAAAADNMNIYDLEAVYIFEHLGAPERAMISFIDKGHMMVFEPEMVARMAHFAVAFFGYHLQGRDDYAYYFSQDFVAQHADLAWGVFVP